MNKKSNEKGPRSFYFDVGKKDPNAMDIDVMSMEKWAALWEKELVLFVKKQDT